MPQYKLTYFNGRGRAELSRLIFAAAGMNFEDNRIDQNEWPDLKPTTPYKTLPVLEVDGKIVGQSASIARYLSRELGLSGKISLDEAKADGIVEAMLDITPTLTEIIMAKDKKKKADLAKDFERGKGPDLFSVLETILKENKNGDGFFVGDRMTYADLAFMNLAQTITENTKLPLDKYPKLKGLYRRIKETPNIVKYLKKRPVTQF